MLQQTKPAEERWTERVGAPPRLLTPFVFPDDALAVIYRPTRSANTSGKARTRHWKMRCERRAAPYIEPLMGWTGLDDPLAQVELTFPTPEAAAAYARRHGLAFVVQGGIGSSELRLVSPPSRATNANRVRRPQLEWVERTLLPDTMLKETMSAGLPRRPPRRAACRVIDHGPPHQARRLAPRERSPASFRSGRIRLLRGSREH